MRADKDRRLVRLSKYLSKCLRHKPEELGIELGPGGWASVDELLAASACRGFPISREELDEVVAYNDKKRFAFDESGARIRAQQGHSVPVDLGLEPAEPPPTLYHGTPEYNLPKIVKLLSHASHPLRIKSQERKLAPRWPTGLEAKEERQYVG